MLHRGLIGAVVEKAWQTPNGPRALVAIRLSGRVEKAEIAAKHPLDGITSVVVSRRPDGGWEHVPVGVY